MYIAILNIVRLKLYLIKVYRVCHLTRNLGLAVCLTMKPYYHTNIVFHLVLESVPSKSHLSDLGSVPFSCIIVHPYNCVYVYDMESSTCSCRCNANNGTYMLMNCHHAPSYGVLVIFSRCWNSHTFHNNIPF